jgi:hypothetical protein
VSIKSILICVVKIVVPDPKTPGSLDHQISSGRFPKGATSGAAKSLSLFHITFTAITMTLCFILIVQ